MITTTHWIRCESIKPKYTTDESSVMTVIDIILLIYAIFTYALAERKGGPMHSTTKNRYLLVLLQYDIT